MRHVIVAAITLVLTASAIFSDAQDLAGRIDAIRDGTVRLSFETRPEICGDGRSIGERTPDGFVLHTMWRDGYSIQSFEDWEPNCRTGPLRLVVIKSAGQVVELRAAVGVEWRTDPSVTDFGLVTGANVAQWLLDPGQAMTDRIARVAFLAANAAQGAAIADRVINLVKDRSQTSELRQRAMRWVNTTARREGKTAEADQLLRDIAAESGDRSEVRERAIRVLRPSPRNDAFLRALYGQLRVHDLRERIIRRVGESGSEEDAQWIRRLALNTHEPVSLRERALRVLGDELHRVNEVRDFFQRLDNPQLKERALRIVAEHDSGADVSWLRSVAQNRGESHNVRERAVRLLSERGDVQDMQALYAKLQTAQLKDRVLRLIAEEPWDGSQPWLRKVALDRDEQTSLRDRAIRILGDRDAAEVRRLFDQLELRELKDRALRMAGDHGDVGTVMWLKSVATDSAYARPHRDRALRLLADHAIATVELAALYDSVRGEDLKRRVIRLLVDRDDEPAVDKLIAVAEHDPDPDLRRFAIRRLGEARHPRAQAFLERSVERP